MTGNAVKPRLRRHEWRALVVCILLSATIWVLRALNAPSTGQVEIKLRYAGDSECAVANCIPPTLGLEVESSGFEILGQMLFPRRKALDIESAYLVEKGSERFVLTASLEKEFRNLLGSGFEVTSMSIDSIVIHCTAPDTGGNDSP